MSSGPPGSSGCSPRRTRRCCTASGPAVGTDAVRAFGAPPAYLRRAYGDGWALVGDAGSWKDPIGMHGITDALRDAELLARAVAAAPGPGVRRNLALASYQADRDRLSARLLDVIDDIASFEWDQPRLRRLLVELAAAMTDEVEAIVAFDHGDTSTLAA